MTSLNEACIYLLRNWDTFLEMAETEDEINKYLINLSSKIEDEIKSHPDFPKDWHVESYTDEDEGYYSEIEALPKVWQEWNDKKDWLGYVAFDSLNVVNFLAKTQDERAKFGLFLGLGNRVDPFSKEQAEKLWRISKDYEDKLSGFQWQEEYDKETCLFKHIEKIPIPVIQNEKELINFVVSGILPVIKVVDQIKTKHFPKTPK